MISTDLNIRNSFRDSSKFIFENGYSSNVADNPKVMQQVTLSNSGSQTTHTNRP